MTNWDAIVVGSGVSGLSAAAYLTANGTKTLVLEQNQIAGGYTQVFRRQGNKYEFDVGVHYFGDCGPDGSITSIMNALGLAGKLEFRELDPDGFATHLFPDCTFRVPRGWDNYLARLIETFPAEEKGLRRCVGIMRRISRELDAIMPVNGRRSLLSFFAKAPVSAMFALLPTSRLFDLCRLSPQARAVIFAEAPDYGSAPSETPATRLRGRSLPHRTRHLTTT